MNATCRPSRTNRYSFRQDCCRLMMDEERCRGVDTAFGGTPPDLGPIDSRCATIVARDGVFRGRAAPIDAHLAVNVASHARIAAVARESTGVSSGLFAVPTHSPGSRRNGDPFRRLRHHSRSFAFFVDVL